MKVVSVMNYKGGVGKTTVTANLAADLACRGHRVLMIDMDPQASLTFSFIQPDLWERELSEHHTIKAWYDAMESRQDVWLRNLIHYPERVTRGPKLRGSLGLIASHLGLLNIDVELASKLGGTSLRQSKRNFVAIHRRLLDGLRDIRHDFDLVLIDCPPSFSIVTQTAIVASQHVLVPARLDYLSTLGIDYLIRSQRDLVRDYNEFVEVDDGLSIDKIQPRLAGVVFTMIQEYSGGPVAAQRRYIEALKDQGTVHVFDNYIKRNDTVVAEAAQSGVPVVLQRLPSVAHRAVVLGFEAVTREFADRIGL